MGYVFKQEISKRFCIKSFIYYVKTLPRRCILNIAWLILTISPVSFQNCLCLHNLLKKELIIHFQGKLLF